jgi:hypothetical protein
MLTPYEIAWLRRHNRAVHAKLKLIRLERKTVSA